MIYRSPFPDVDIPLVSLPEFLFEHATQPAFIYRHQWRVHDLVFWDNRCTIHHAIRDYGDAARHMHRTTICGDVPH